MTAVSPPPAPLRPAMRAGAGPVSSQNRALAAARDSLLEIGATRTTMVEVARRSGVGRTTLYRHWPDISALFADLLTRELTTAVDSLTTWAAESGLRQSEPPTHEPRKAEDIADLVCGLADALRTDPMLDALRRHESELLAVYLLQRLGTAQHHLIGVLRDALERVVTTDHRLAGRDADRTAHMLFLAVQGVVLSAPLADPPLDPDAWRAELSLLVKGYLGL